MDPLPGVANYFLGNNSALWHTNIPTYSRIRYSDIYKGIDLLYYGNQHQLEFDFVIAPGAAPKSIRFRLSGATHIDKDATGALVLALAEGTLVFRKPTLYQEIRGVRQSVEGGFHLAADKTVSFTVGPYDHTKPLVIDPSLAYATYLGGSTQEYAVAIAADAAGEAYVTGLTWSLDFPLTPGAFESVNQAYAVSGVSTAFVSKLNSSGTALLYSTYLGGTAIANTEYGQGDYGHAIAIDTQGNAYITGWTYSTNFPVTTGAFQTTNKAAAHAEATGFVSKLNSNGTVLIYSTFLGGSTLDEPTSIALDNANNVVTTGYTLSTDYPTSSGAFQTTNNSGSTGNWNIFVSKLNSNGSGLVYSTYLGGSGERGSTIDGEYYIPSVAVDSSGDAYVLGFAQSSDFPVTSGAYQTTNKAFTNGGANLTLSKINSGGTALVYSTYIGGTSYPGDFCQGIALDSSGNAYVTGDTYSSDFPVTSGAFQTTNKGAALGINTGFVTKVNSGGTGLIYSTFLGGSSGDGGYGVALDASLDVYVVGTTASTDFPVTSNAYQSSLKGQSDAFLVELGPSGSSAVYSTYFGGSGEEAAYQAALDPLGNIYLSGYTTSSDFPVTAGAFKTAYNSAQNTAFVAEFGSGASTSLTPTTTSLTASQNPQSQGNSVTFTAVVTPASGSSTPSGSVVFNVDESPIATVPLDSTGKASFATSALPVSEHYILATYSGSNVFAQSAGSLSETITGTTAMPVITPSSGTYAVPQTVAITDATAGATIYYTLDGSTPSTSSSIYALPFTPSSTTTVKAMAVASGDTQSAVATTTYTIAQGSMTLLDPTPFAGVSLLDGAAVVSQSALANPSAGLKSGADRLATQGRIVQGVAADGVAEVVIRIPASQLGQTFPLTVETEAKDDGTTQPSTSVEEDGGLAATGPAPTFQSSVTASAVATSSGQYYAFAVYRAPLDFVRSGNTYDTAKGQKQIVITVGSQPVQVTLIRPPIFLIHGIWSKPAAWNYFTALTTDPRFSPLLEAANYAGSNGLSVSFNEYFVFSQMTQWIAQFAIQNEVAATQADIVAHSMGGLIARDMVRDPRFYSSGNYGSGTIHKLITIDTPHNGSDFAPLLVFSKPLGECPLAFSLGGHTVAGGVEDLIPNSALLNSLNSGPATIISHAIVGEASSTQESTSEALINDPDSLVPWLCHNLLGNGFESIFSGSSDLIVSASSQQFGFISSAVSLSPGTIHAVIHNLFEPGPDALDTSLLNGQLIGSATPINSPKVVDLLNTPITDPSFGNIQP
jgi:pimeloyl-ACP methyl ester carboxylesterase